MKFSQNTSSNIGSARTIPHLSQGLVMGPNDGEKLMRRWGHSFLIKIDELNGGAKQFSVGSEKLLPGESIHVHRHKNCEELLMITSGRGALLLGNQYITVEPGSLVFIPEQVWHGLENTGIEDIELLWIFPKLGMEKYFRATSVSAGHQSLPLSNEELNLIRAQHIEDVEYRDSTLTHYINQ